MFLVPVSPPVRFEGAENIYGNLRHHAVKYQNHSPRTHVDRRRPCAPLPHSLASHQERAVSPGGGLLVDTGRGRFRRGRPGEEGVLLGRLVSLSCFETVFSILRSRQMALRQEHDLRGRRRR